MYSMLKLGQFYVVFLQTVNGIQGYMRLGWGVLSTFSFLLSLICSQNCCPVVN